MNHPDFHKLFPAVVPTEEEVAELLRDGYVAIAVGGGRVFTLRLEWAESDIPEVDFTDAKPGIFHVHRPKS